MWMWNFLQEMENWCSAIEIKSRISHWFDLDVSAVGSFFHPFLFFQVRVTDIGVTSTGLWCWRETGRMYLPSFLSTSCGSWQKDWDWGPKWHKWAVSTPNTRWRVFGKSPSVWFSLRPVDHLLCSVLHHMDFVHASWQVKVWLYGLRCNASCVTCRKVWGCSACRTLAAIAFLTDSVSRSCRCLNDDRPLYRWCINRWCVSNFMTWLRRLLTRLNLNQNQIRRKWRAG